MRYPNIAVANDHNAVLQQNEVHHLKGELSFREGNDESWRPDGKHSLGAAVRKFVDQQAKGDTPLEKTSAFKRLVNIINSHELDEQAVHLRGLIQLLKSEDIPLDYTSLAWDLYRLQFPETKKEVTLRWGRQVYRTQKTDDTLTEEQ